MLGTSRGRGEGSLQRRALREAAPLAERAGGERGEARRSAPFLKERLERRCVSQFHLPEGVGCPLVVLEDPPAVVRGQRRNVDGHGNGSALPHLGVY